MLNSIHNFTHFVYILSCPGGYHLKWPNCCQWWTENRGNGPAFSALSKMYRNVTDTMHISLLSCDCSHIFSPLQLFPWFPFPKHLSSCQMCREGTVCVREGRSCRESQSDSYLFSTSLLNCYLRYSVQCYSNCNQTVLVDQLKPKSVPWCPY